MKKSKKKMNKENKNYMNCDKKITSYTSRRSTPKQIQVNFICQKKYLN